MIKEYQAIVEWNDGIIFMLRNKAGRTEFETVEEARSAIAAIKQHNDGKSGSSDKTYIVGYAIKSREVTPWQVEEREET